MIRIKSKKKSLEKTIKKIRHIEEYESLAMAQYFEDSALENVHLNRQVIADIHDFVEDSLSEKTVCEVGGFLLGNESEQEGICIELFVPAYQIDKSSPSRLHFGAGSMQELDAFRDRYPEYQMKGWFHTHTAGLMPFLSRLDIRIHEGFFTQQDQIAIVLDVKTDGFQTGVFTRQQNGTLNNIKDIKGRKPIYWKQILEVVNG